MFIIDPKASCTAPLVKRSGSDSMGKKMKPDRRRLKKFNPE